MTESKSTRIELELHEMAEEMAQKLGMATRPFINVALRQGMENIQERGIKMPKIEEKTPKIDAETLLNNAKNAASKGSETLRGFLRGITPQEEQAIKYDIRALKELGAEADKNALLSGRKDAIAQGDEICLQGMEALTAWLGGLHVDMRKSLDAHAAEWKKDARRSDDSMRLLKKRPTKRQFGFIKQQKVVTDKAQYEKEERDFEAAIKNPDPFADGDEG